MKTSQDSVNILLLTTVFLTLLFVSHCDQLTEREEDCQAVGLVYAHEAKMCKEPQTENETEGE